MMFSFVAFVVAAAATTADQLHQLFSTKIIVNGQSVEDDTKYPFMAVLLMRGPRSLEMFEARPEDFEPEFLQFPQICTATIISDKWILTAAHCVDLDIILDGGERLTAVEAFSIRVGAVDGSVPNSVDAGAEYNIARVIIHPTYEMTGGAVDMGGDIALIELESSIEFGPTVSTVELANEPSYDTFSDGDSVTQIGWGSTSQSYYTPTTPERLQEIEGSFLHGHACEQRMNNLRMELGIPGQMEMQDGQICVMPAGDVVGGACNGDSGGPLIANGVQHGIASYVTAKNWEELCGAQYPDVYVEVSCFLSWISAETGIWFGESKCTPGGVGSGVGSGDGDKVWTCNPSYFEDGLCDCECGIWDPDCDTHEFGDFVFCNEGGDFDMVCDRETLQCVEGPAQSPVPTHKPTPTPTSSAPSPVPTAMPTELPCAENYEYKDGDYPGFTSVNGRGGGESVPTCDACAELCDSDGDCLAYECSHTELRCNLVASADPTKGPYGDYNFCSKLPINRAKGLLEKLGRILDEIAGF